MVLSMLKSHVQMNNNILCSFNAFTIVCLSRFYNYFLLQLIRNFSSFQIIKNNFLVAFTKYNACHSPVFGGEQHDIANL